jgi:hypothetical protein
MDQQKDQAKGDLTDSQRKFELTLEQLQKKASIEKEKLDANYQALINSNEQRYKAKIKDEHDSHQLILSELTSKCKQLEKENKQMQERLHVDQKGRITEHSTLEKKVTELMENEKQLLKECSEVKAEKDAKVLEYQKQLDKEKETHKAKQQEIETKYKEAESKKSILLFDFEKERAKWALEKDHISNQKNELQEAIERLEKKKETLLRENEKLRNEKGARRPMYNGITNTSIYGANKYNSNVNKSILNSLKEKENINQDDTKSTHSNISGMEDKLNKSKMEDEKLSKKEEEKDSCRAIH